MGVTCRLVYILEAHARDEWPVGSAQFSYPQAQTLEQRAQAAIHLWTRLQLEIPIVLDGPTNDFERLYAPWPFRFYILRNGVVLQRADPISGGYDLGSIWEFLDHLIT